MSTSYTVQPWADGTVGSTPVTAATLSHIESGVGGAHDRIDALTVGVALTPTAVRTSTVPPAAGQLVTYDASGSNIGTIALPSPQPGVIMGVVKGDSSSNTITFSSGNFIGNGGSTTITLRKTGEFRTLYGSVSGWYVTGLPAPIVGTSAGTVAAGDDARFANTLTTALYGGPTRTVAPLCIVDYTGTGFSVGAADQYVSGGFTARKDTDAMYGNVGGFGAVTIPVTGTYEYQFTIIGALSVASGYNCRITRNAQTIPATIAYDCQNSAAGGSAVVDARNFGVLNAGDQLYFAAFCSAGSWHVNADVVTTGRSLTGMTVRYIGPA